MRHLRDLLLLVQHVNMDRKDITSRVGAAPENNCAILVGGIPQDLVQLHGKSVEVSNVQRTKIAMERIVQQGLVDAEVHWGMRFGSSRCGTSLRPRRPLRRRCALLRVGERCGCVGCVRIRSKVESILYVLDE